MGTQQQTRYCRFSAVSPASRRYRSTAAAAAGECGQCHVVSIRRHRTQTCYKYAGGLIFGVYSRVYVAHWQWHHRRPNWINWKRIWSLAKCGIWQLKLFESWFLRYALSFSLHHARLNVNAYPAYIQRVWLRPHCTPPPNCVAMRRAAARRGAGSMHAVWTRLNSSGRADFAAQSLASLDFADDFAVEQRQQSVVVRHFLVHNPTVKLVTRLPKKVPGNRIVA